MATVLHPAEVRSFDELLIGGRWVQPSSDRRIVSISPVTEEAITHVPEAQPADIDAAVAAARRASDEGPWPRMAPAERAARKGLPRTSKRSS
jgi:aldehyde dehydrogenase (NAD+)